MKTYVVYGTFEMEIEADSEGEAKALLDIEDADITIQGCYEVDDGEVD